MLKNLAALVSLTLCLAGCGSDSSSSDKPSKYPRNVVFHEETATPHGESSADLVKLEQRDANYFRATWRGGEKSDFTVTPGTPTIEARITQSDLQERISSRDGVTGGRKGPGYLLRVVSPGQPERVYVLDLPEYPVAAPKSDG